MMLRNGIQDDILNLGKYGCAFLCALRYFQYDIDDISKITALCLNEKIIDNEFTVLSWERLFETIDPNKNKWKVDIVYKDKITDDELKNYDCVIAQYTNVNSHFVLLDKELKIKYDGLYNSITVKYGKIKSYRVFTKK